MFIHTIISGGSRISRRVGGGGGVDSRGGYVSKILYVKTKESGPLGGVRLVSAYVDLPMIMLSLNQKNSKKTCHCLLSLFQTLI